MYTISIRHHLTPIWFC